MFGLWVARVVFISLSVRVGIHKVGADIFIFSTCVYAFVWLTNQPHELARKSHIPSCLLSREQGFGLLQVRERIIGVFLLCSYIRTTMLCHHRLVPIVSAYFFCFAMALVIPTLTVPSCCYLLTRKTTLLWRL